MDSKRKAKKMSVAEVSGLIKSRIQHNNLFINKRFDKKEAWRTILQSSGLHIYTIDQVKAKWNNLTKKYKQLIAPPTGGATENGEQRADQWVHFDQMHEFMSSQHTCYPPLVVNSNGDIIRNAHNSPEPIDSEFVDSSCFDVSDYIVFDPEPSADSVEDSTTCEYSAFAPSEYDGIQNRASTPMSTDSAVAVPSGFGRQRSTNDEDDLRNIHTDKKRKKRYSQQDMFQFFREECKRKRKESKQCLMLLKSIAQAQNIDMPMDDSSSSDSEM
ncbi:uncharacterized protein LOC134215114 isoform X2 [Armigeres subalbatus]|uniref:uncharacterized protein LOC134215114 isoform X2 n=1 Tax=Armigeres subalbatus TaxID=124917 RepID=UPI002ED4D0DC